MTQNSGNDQSSARREQLQAVFDRVDAWQESAPESTVRDELKKALDESGFGSLDEKSFNALAEHIEDERGPADVADLVDPSALQ